MRVENSDMKLEDYEGKKIRVTFLDSKALTGKLLKVKGYELYLHVEKDNKIICVFKHALMYLYEVED